jgi:hypothetical protein
VTVEPFTVGVTGVVTNGSDKCTSRRHVRNVKAKGMLAEMPLHIQPGGAIQRSVGARSIDAIGDILGFSQIRRRGITGVKVFQVPDGVSDTQSIDGLHAAHDPDIHRLGHGQSCRIPVSRQGIRCDSHAGAAHARRARADSHKFCCERGTVEHHEENSEGTAKDHNAHESRLHGKKVF